MYDTHVTVVGNVLHEPEWRKTANTGALVTTFKIASTSRRLNRDTGQWVDGNSLRVRVTCWRALASNVKDSVTRGDPLIVAGRLFTRDWVDESGTRRTLYELEAATVGHDLSRGRAVFERVKANTSTSTIEDAQSQQRIGGEPTEPVPDDEAPAHFNRTTFDAVFDRPVEVPVGGPDGPDADPVGAPPDGPDAPDGLPGPDGSAVPGAPAGADGAEPPDGIAVLAAVEEEAAQAADGEAATDETAPGRRRGVRRARVPA